MSASEVGDKLGLYRIKNRKWFIQSSSAVNGDGLYEGLEWISRNVESK